MRDVMRVACVLAVTPMVAGACGSVESQRESGAYAVVNDWPRLAPGFRFDQVAGVAVNSRNEVLVFHRGDRSWLDEEGPIRRPTILTVDAASGRVLDSLGAGLFRNPHGIAVDTEDNIWIADNNLHQVFKLSPSGEVLMTLGEAGVRGADATHFSGVTDVAVAADGSIYVTDGYGNNRLVKFSPSGEVVFEIGSAEPGDGPGQFRLPHGVTLDAAGRVYVADRSNVRIQVFEPDGTFITQWKSEALGRPWGLEVASDGFLYVVDGGDYWLTRQFLSERPDTLPRDRARVHRMDLDGNILDTFGSYGQYAGQMIWPHDVAVDRAGGIYVAEVHQGMRVQKFSRVP